MTPAQKEAIDNVLGDDLIPFAEQWLMQHIVDCFNGDVQLHAEADPDDFDRSGRLYGPDDVDMDYINLFDNITDCLWRTYCGGSIATYCSGHGLTFVKSGEHFVECLVDKALDLASDEDDWESRDYIITWAHELAEEIVPFGLYTDLEGYFETRKSEAIVKLTPIATTSIAWATEGF